MSSATFAGTTDTSGGSGFCSAPPPPPPPPGQVPAMRINTIETPVSRRPQSNNNDPYEPPAAIQNAMMTKDKKPFTYTPGMGGKLDLSQIRSPRMARRVAKNANDEGIEGPPKSPLAAEQQPRPVSTGANLFMQPQVAVPVFPTGNVPSMPLNRAPQVTRVPSNACDRNPEPPRPSVKIEPKLPSQPNSLDSPTTPPQVMLAKAPTPWLQNKNKSQEELPEWAKRNPTNGTLSYSPPQTPAAAQMIYVQQEPVQMPPVPPRQSQPQQRVVTQMRPVPTQSQDRIIPIQVEDRPSVFTALNEPGHHHQLNKSAPHHQSRWGDPMGSNPPVQATRVVSSAPKPQPQSPGTFIVPIMVEGSNNSPPVVVNSGYQQQPNSGYQQQQNSGYQQQQNSGYQQQPNSGYQQQQNSGYQQQPNSGYQQQPNSGYQQPQNSGYQQPQNSGYQHQPNSGYQQQQSAWDQNQPGPAQNQIRGNVQQRTPVGVQQEPAPVQSRSFRVLQKITSTDADDMDPEQLRKLHLTEDDKILMSKFKDQVDGDTYLHQEEDPRYRGSAIPSRAFRYLQNMTDSGEAAANANEENQPNLPASEQQVHEPKKYTGSAIPSRSFKMLQAMTTPESVAKQEIRQADFTCRTELLPQGKQQGVFIPRYPQPIYWAYYPIPYPPNYHHHHQQQQTINMNEQNNQTPYIYYGYQDEGNPPTIADNFPYYYPIYDQQFCPNNLQLCATDQNYINCLETPNSIEPVVEKNSDDLGFNQIINSPNNQAKEINSSQVNSLNKIDDAPRNCEIGSMNILHEENAVERKIEETDGSTNDDNVESEDTTSESSELSSAENCPVDDEIEGDSSSESESDSASYLAYSTGRNPKNKNPPEDDDDEISAVESEDDKRNSTDCESLTEEEEVQAEIKNVNEKNQVITIRSDTPNEIDAMGWKDVPEDDEIPTTVSVRLPLRLKFSVSTEREEATTVVIGQSSIEESLKNQLEDESKVISNVKIENEPNTTVDFTLKKNSRPKSWCHEKFSDDFWTSQTVSGEQDSSSINSEIQRRTISEETCEEKIETQSNDENPREEEISQEKSDQLAEDEKEKDEEEENEEEEEEEEEEEDEEEVEESDDGEEDEKEKEEVKSVPQFEVTVEEQQKDDEEESADESKKNKYLLTVQNSRDETDDDDSGVTSDMSRLISEVDTDSECAPTRKLSSYKRTQTHSRLFRLLSEDLPVEDKLENDKSKRKNRLSLPLKNGSNGFNYDCSNYSSGLTSPDYSPVHEPTWKNLQETSPDVQSSDSNTKDRYFKTWKEAKEDNKQNQEVVTSLSSKLMESKIPCWSYKSNVLCPRIRSTKSVPKAIQGRIRKPVIHPVPSSCGKYDRC